MTATVPHAQAGAHLRVGTGPCRVRPRPHPSTGLRHGAALPPAGVSAGVSARVLGGLLRVELLRAPAPADPLDDGEDYVPGSPGGPDRGDDRGNDRGDECGEVSW